MGELTSAPISSTANAGSASRPGWASNCAPTATKSRSRPAAADAGSDAGGGAGSAAAALSSWKRLPRWVAVAELGPAVAPLADDDELLWPLRECQLHGQAMRAKPGGRSARPPNFRRRGRAGLVLATKPAPRGSRQKRARVNRVK